MAFGQRNELKLSMTPLTNGTLVDDDEDTVQTMWNSVRANYSTDMPALRFKQMGYQQSLKWSAALKDFVCTRFQAFDQVFLVRV